MRKTHSEVQQHILAVTTTMITETGSTNVRVSAIAERANVGVPTIYYHFASLPELISLAQGQRLNKLYAPFDDILTAMIRAVDSEDEDAYWAAWDEVFLVGWTRERNESMWDFPQLLCDVHRDSALAGQIKEKQEHNLKQRIGVIDKAKSLGWIDADVDSRSLSLIFWGAFLGLRLNFGSDLYVLEPEKVKALFLKIMMGQPDQTARSDN